MLYIAVLLLLCAQPEQPTQAQFEAHEQAKTELEFDRHWIAYLLAKFGCLPQTGHVVAPIDKEDCKNPSIIRYDENLAAKKLAMKMWGLEEKNDKH